MKVWLDIGQENKYRKIRALFYNLKTDNKIEEGFPFRGEIYKYKF